VYADLLDRDAEAVADGHDQRLLGVVFGRNAAKRGWTDRIAVEVIAACVLDIPGVILRRALIERPWVIEYG